MANIRLTTYNPAAGEPPNYMMGTGQSLIGDKGYIGGLCQQVKDSITGGDFNFSSRHLMTGEIMNRNNISYTNQFRNIVGYNYIWTGTGPNLTELDPSTSGESHPSLGDCLQVRTDKNAKGTYGLMLGDWTGHEYLERRWTCPIGIQFEWSNLHTNSNSSGFAMTGLIFYYMSKRLQISQYIELIYRDGKSDGAFNHPDSGTSGKNLLSNIPSEVGGNEVKTGKVIAYVDPTGISKIKNNKENFYLHGIEMRFYYDGSDISNMKKFIHFYNIKLLHDLNVTNNSRIVVPQVHSREMYFQTGGYPI